MPRGGYTQDLTANEVTAGEWIENVNFADPLFLFLSCYAPSLLFI